MTDLRSLTFEELQAALAPFGWPAFRARQIFEWLQAKGARDARGMTNLPKDLRGTLDRQCFISACEIARKQVSQDGTVKYLFALHDGEKIESAVMRYEHGRSICVSSQAGCSMGCVFCASGEKGRARDLLPGEMLAQIMEAQNDFGGRVSHVVLMGMGEPLDNYDNVLKFLRLASAPGGLNISQRRISLSTCGLVPKIYALANERLGITLSVSLHAPNDALRTRLMPVNKAYPIKELMQACADYAKKTSRRISFEYAMFQGVNDTQDHASELAALLKHMLCHVNLIPANAWRVECGEWREGLRRSDRAAIQAFQECLTRKGIACTVRRSLGQDISAACGQLRGQETG